MRTIASQLESSFREAIRQAVGVDADPLITVAQNEKFGDYQSNAAMGLAKGLAERTGQKANPRTVAEQIKSAVTPLLGAMAAELSVAGPGFINVRLSPVWLAGQLAEAGRDERLGVGRVETPVRTVVDYSGPNIAKEMHVGHLRSTIIGDAIARVIEFRGDEVIRQNHIGDWGTQFGMLIAFLKRSGAAGESHIQDLEGFYRAAKKQFDDDAGFAEEARRTVVRLQAGEAGEMALWERIVEETRRHNQPVYQRLDVKLTRENERGESFYNSMLGEVVQELTAQGVAVKSEGAIVCFVEGFENPLIIEKTGGGYLYATTDLAAIRYRVGILRAQRIIYVTGAPQGQHFTQVFAVARQAGWAQGVSLEHAGFGSVLGEDGKMFKTRSGGTVKLKELLDEAEERAYAIVTEKSPDLPEDRRRQIAHAVGVGAVKYADLSKDRITDYVFSWDKMLSFDGNTAPYLQNAYVRVHGIFRKAKSAGIEVSPDYSKIRLESPFELALAKHVMRLGDTVALVARELKPHHLCTYLFELATKYHAFFENCPVLQSEEPTRSSRLAICSLVAKTLGLGLDLLGIEHPEQM
jgi:arginyl-tRNA synthetase